MGIHTKSLLTKLSHEDQPLDHEFYSRRRLLTMSGLLLDMTTNALASGFSPLVLPVGHAFRGPGTSGGDTFAEGMFLYVFFVRFSISMLWGFVFLDKALSRYPAHAGYHMLTLALWPLGLAMVGWAITQRSVGCVLMAAALMGIGHGPAKYNGAVLLPSWWAVDGKVKNCQVMLGFVRGLGAIFWITFFGTFTRWVGQDNIHMTFFLTAIIQASVLVLVVAPVLSKAEFHQIPRLQPTKDSLGDSSTHSGESSSLLMDWRFYAISITNTSVSFSGLGIKQLLAVIYQEGAQLSYSSSAHYAAGSLVLYWLLMTLSPLMGTQKLLLPMYGAALASEAALYGLSPMAVDTGNVSLLLSCRVVSGGLLAVMFINKTLLITEVIGKDRLKRFKSLSAPLEVLGGAGGLAAWLLHVGSMAGDVERSNAEQEQASFNGFFQLSALLMFCSALLVLLLWVDSIVTARRS